MCIESVPGGMSSLRHQLSSSSDSRKSSMNKDYVNHSTKQLFEESMDLFANDDKELQKQSVNRRPIDYRKQEADLRQYYKSRVQGRRSVEIDRKMTGKSDQSNSCDSKKNDRFPLAQKSNTIDVPPPGNSLAIELLNTDNPQTTCSPSPRANSLPGKQFASVEGKTGLETSQDDSSVDVFTDDENDNWQTSTPLKNDHQPTNEESLFMWVASDTSW